MSKKEVKKEEDPYRSSRCTCGSEKIEPHTCPFAEEIGEDFETLCDCCDYCTTECAMDI